MRTRLFAIALSGALAASPAAAHELRIDFHVVGTAKFSLSYDPWFYDNHAVIDDLAPPYDYTRPVSGVIRVTDIDGFGTVVGLFDTYTLSGPVTTTSVSGVDWPVSFSGPDAFANIHISNGTGTEGAFVPPGTAIATEIGCVSNGGTLAYCALSAAYRVTSVDSVVPEPSTWAMMLIAFAGLGYFKRRQGAGLDRLGRDISHPEIQRTPLVGEE